MKKGLITSILALTFTGLQAQPLPATPKLVVTLTIDQLRTDYMEAFSTLYGEKGFKRLMRRESVLPDRIPFQRNRPRFCHRCHLQRHDAFDERHHIPVLDGCKHPAPRELRGRRRIYGQLHRRKLFSLPITDLDHCRRTESCHPQQRPGVCHRPLARRGRTGCRTYRKRCFLAEREHRQMVQHYILQRVPVVGKPVQRTEITRLPHPRHGMGTGTPHQQIYIPARMAGPALQI